MKTLDLLKTKKKVQSNAQETSLIPILTKTDFVKIIERYFVSMSVS